MNGVERRPARISPTPLVPTSLQASTGTGKRKGQAHPEPDIRRPALWSTGMKRVSCHCKLARLRARRMPQFGPLCQTQSCHLLLCLSGATGTAESSAFCVDDTLACALVVDRQLLKALLSDSSAAMPPPQQYPNMPTVPLKNVRRASLPRSVAQAWPASCCLHGRRFRGESTAAPLLPCRLSRQPLKS